MTQQVREVATTWPPCARDLCLPSFLHTHRLVGVLRGIAWELLYQEEQEASDFGLIAVQEGLIANFPLISQVLNDGK